MTAPTVTRIPRMHALPPMTTTATRPLPAPRPAPYHEAAQRTTPPGRERSGTQWHLMAHAAKAPHE